MPLSGLGIAAVVFGAKRRIALLAAR